MFETSRPTVFRDLLAVVGAVIESPTLRFSQEGLRVLEMGVDHCDMIDLHLPTGFFDVWSVEEEFMIGLNLPQVLKTLKKMNRADHRMDLAYDPATAEASFMLKSDINREKVFPTLEPQGAEVPVPKLFFKSKTRMILATLKRVLDDFQGHQYWTVETTQEMITLSVKDDDARESTSIKAGNDNILEHRVDEDSRVTSTHKYIHDFVKAAVKVSEVATMELSTDLPIKLDVELPMGRLIYHVAPAMNV